MLVLRAGSTGFSVYFMGGDTKMLRTTIRVAAGALLALASVAGCSINTPPPVAATPPTVVVQPATPAPAAVVVPPPPPAPRTVVVQPAPTY